MVQIKVSLLPLSLKKRVYSPVQDIVTNCSLHQASLPLLGFFSFFFSCCYQYSTNWTQHPHMPWMDLSDERPLPLPLLPAPWEMPSLVWSETPSSLLHLVPGEHELGGTLCLRRAVNLLIIEGGHCVISDILKVCNMNKCLLFFVLLLWNDS